MQLPFIETKALPGRLTQIACELEEEAENLRMLILHLESVPQTVEELVFRLYLEEGKIATVAAKIRNAGIKTSDGKSFQSTHVSQILKSTDRSMIGNDTLIVLARKLLTSNTDKVENICG